MHYFIQFQDPEKLSRLEELFYLQDQQLAHYSEYNSGHLLNYFPPDLGRDLLQSRGGHSFIWLEINEYQVGSDIIKSLQLEY